MPIKHDLRSNFLYNNGLYELAGHVVERISGYSNWGDFQHDYIFEPLGMNRTTAFRDVHETDKNIAKPYMILTDGTPFYVPPTELSADSMNGGSGGLRSSDNDLLKWSQCLLSALNGESKTEDVVRHASPIFNRCTIASPEDTSASDYCTGWCHHRTPAELGLISPNRVLVSPMLGSDSPFLLVYGHQGDVPGYTCNIYIIPSSNSAVVVLSNSTGLGDVTDWIAQDIMWNEKGTEKLGCLQRNKVVWWGQRVGQPTQHIIQTMSSGLQPKVDFVATATRAAEVYLTHYAKDYQAPLEEHGGPRTAVPALGGFVGTYVMDNLDIASLEVVLDPEDPASLQTMVNGCRDQAMLLRHYNHDVFSYLPDSYDECLKRGVDRTQWSAFLIFFLRDEEGKVTGFGWKLDGVDTSFSRRD